MLIHLQSLEFLSLQPLPLQFLSVWLVNLNRSDSLIELRVLVVMMVVGFNANSRIQVLMFGVGMRVVLVNIGEGVLQGLEPSEILVSLGFPVSTLGTILVQNAIEGRLTHFNNSNQTKLIVWHLAGLFVEKTIMVRRFIAWISYGACLIVTAFGGLLFISDCFFCVTFELAYSQASTNISDLPFCSFSSPLKPQIFSSAATVNHRRSVVGVALILLPL